MNEYQDCSSNIWLGVESQLGGESEQNIAGDIIEFADNSGFTWLNKIITQSWLNEF